MSRVTIKSTGQVFEVPSDQSLLEALKEQGIYIKSSCGGVASCSDCIVKVLEGMDHLSSPDFKEIQLLGNVFHITKERLSCQAKTSGDIVLDITQHNKASDQRKLRQKTSKPPLKKVSKEEVKKKVEKKQLEEIEKEKEYEEKKKKDEGWFKHWESENPAEVRPKKFGGGKRPRNFRFDEETRKKAEEEEEERRKKRHQQNRGGPSSRGEKFERRDNSRKFDHKKKR